MERKRRTFPLSAEKFFYQLGLSIGRKPWTWLIGSLCLSAAFAPGLLLWKEELDDVELFIPRDSVIRSDAAWIKKHFRDDVRYESIIVIAPNVLSPEVLLAIADIEEDVKNVIVRNHTWRDVCAGYLTWFENASGNETLSDEWQGIFREMNQTVLKNQCVYQSLLRLWEPEVIRNASVFTKKRILEDVSASLRNEKHVLLDLAPLLSRTEYNKTGELRGAKATILNYMLKNSQPGSEDWESEFVNKVLGHNRTLPPEMSVFAIASRSFDDLLAEIIKSNMRTLFLGMLLLFVYVTAMISRRNLVRQRIFLSAMSLCVIGHTVLVSYGFCFYLGFFYGPLHPILPFLLLGIGVDDTFVILQSLENLSEREKALEVPQRVAKALQYSGSNITVTSFTNMMAFTIGISTALPFLKSFCVFAATGILFLYIYEIIFFVSCLVINERWLENSGDKKQSGKGCQHFVLVECIAPILTNNVVKFLVILVTGVVLGVNCWAIANLEQNFDPLLYLDQNSYGVKFYQKLKEYFPKSGSKAAIYLTGVDYYDEWNELLRLVEELRENPFVNNETLYPWFLAYDQWLKDYHHEVEGKHEFYGYLTEFLLLTKPGQAYIKDMKFDRLPVGNDYNITSSMIEIQHVQLNTSENQERAMQSVRDSLERINFQSNNTHIALFSKEYVSWTANKAAADELVKNLCLEVLAIGAITILLVRNTRVSFWVLCSVIFTLVDLVGSMFFFGLPVEMSSSLVIITCAGLAVDYAAHIGLEFMRTKGTKNERLILTLHAIGPPVFNGGFSTFLAFVVLSTGDAYLFLLVFKLFTAVVMFGLFHGLVFLPVVLSIFGPNEKMENGIETDGYRVAKSDPTEVTKEKEETEFPMITAQDT